MERINGYLDINKYYNEFKIKNNCTQLDLVLNDFILSSSYNYDEHYWLLIEGKRYYFKPTNYPFHEIIAYYIAKQLGINATYYDMAIYNKVKGVISKSYRKPDCQYISGKSILEEYYEHVDKQILTQMGLTDDWKERHDGPYFLDMNNLETIRKALEFKYANKEFFNIEEIMEQFIAKYIFSILTRANDQTSYNWEIEENSNRVALCPLLDNEIMLDQKEATMTLSVGYDDNNTSVKNSLKKFLLTADNKYIDMFLTKLKCFDYNCLFNAFLQTEQQIGIKIPDEIKVRILDIYSLNQKEIFETLDEIDILSKKGR